MKKLLFSVVMISISAFAETKSGHQKADFYPEKTADKGMATRPANVELLEPKALSDVSGNQVTLKWKPIENATAYKVQVATDANFKWLVSEENFVKDTSYNVTGLEAGKTYFWRVYAMKTDNEMGWTSSFASFSSFQVK